MGMSRRKFMEGTLGALGGLIASGGTLGAALASDRREQNMIEIYAADNPFVTLWLNGKDISIDATGCRVYCEPGKVIWGWAEVVVRSDQGGIIAGPDHKPLVRRRYGWVRWAHQDY